MENVFEQLINRIEKEKELTLSCALITAII